MSVIRFGLTLALVIAGSQAAAAESVYTKLVFDDCVTLSTDLQGGRLHCPGYKGYGITFEEGDLRQAVRFGHVGNDELFESFGVFNRINDTIEWRLDDNGVPRAAILRWFLENPDLQTGEVTPQTTGQVLVVSRVGQPGDARACVVGFVDAKANANANVIARVVADGLAGSFGCGSDVPVFHGERGPLATDPMRAMR